jgi:hypothetical protein
VTRMGCSCPCLCTHCPSLLPIEWPSQTFGLAALNVITFGKECFTIKEEDEFVG